MRQGSHSSEDHSGWFRFRAGDILLQNHAAVGGNLQRGVLGVGAEKLGDTVHGLLGIHFLPRPVLRRAGQFDSENILNGLAPAAGTGPPGVAVVVKVDAIRSVLLFEKANVIVGVRDANNKIRNLVGAFQMTLILVGVVIARLRVFLQADVDAGGGERGDRKSVV